RARQHRVGGGPRLAPGVELAPAPRRQQVVEVAVGGAGGGLGGRARGGEVGGGGVRVAQQAGVGGGEPLLYEPEQPARERAVAAGPVRQGVEERELELREALARLGGREGAGHLGEVVAGELLLLAGGERRQSGQEGAH